MKRWAVLTVLFYVLILIVLAVPMLFIAFGNWWGTKDGSSYSLAEAVTIFKEWGFWIWLAVLALGQMLLLLVPLDVTQHRLPARRRLVVPVITTAFFIMALFVSGVFSLLCAIFKDHAFDVFNFYYRVADVDENQNHAAYTRLGFFTIIIVFWVIWGIIFYRYVKADGPDALVKRTTKWLLRGSILELLVAVPSHVIVRHRNDCCAPFGTFWGITTGLAVMLLCFGPGVFFLFAERIQRSRPKSPSPPVDITQAAS
jgi:hypothetical protein